MKYLEYGVAYEMVSARIRWSVHSSDMPAGYAPFSSNLA